MSCKHVGFWYGARSLSINACWLERFEAGLLHFDIKDGKVWLQQNTTDIDVGQELQELGIPKEDIVLNLHPYKRPYTGYGVA